MTIALQPAGTIVGGGPFSVFGVSSVVFPSDANYIVPSGDSGGYDALTLIVTGSISATRSLELPLHNGRPWIVRNAVGTGFDITVIGLTGTGVNVPNGTAVLVYNNGTNFYSAGGGGGGGGTDIPVDGTVRTSNFSPVANTHYKVDTSGGAFAATLPSTPTEGDEIAFTDVTLAWATHSLTITAAGSGITVQDWIAFTTGATTVVNRVGSIRLRYMAGTAKFWAVIQ